MPTFPELNALSRLISALSARFGGPTTVQQNPNSSYDPNYNMRQQRPIQQPDIYTPPQGSWFRRNVWNYLPSPVQGILCPPIDFGIGLIGRLPGGGGIVNPGGGGGTGGGGGGGGGAVAFKPAVYFYPETETPVSIQLANTVELAVNIPAYHPEQGWQVLAYPDGRLKDLNPEYTNLSYYPRNTLWFEYLDDVEASGFYPYIYWDSPTTVPESTTIETGWMVDRDDVVDFFADTLPQAGFNTQEMNDFVDYWQPKLQSLPDATHFKLGFVFTEGMNTYAPMTISPAPTSMQRVFLLVEVNPDRQANTNLQPQAMETYSREGFSVFEWGGGFVASPNYVGELPQVVSYEPITAS